MDMNDVIFSIGGVSQITAPLLIDATDEQIKNHLKNNVIGENIPTLEIVKSQILVFKEQQEKSQFNFIVSNFEYSVQKYLDEEANLHGYDNITNACSYAGAPNPFQTEAISFVTWRGNVWAYCYQELAKVQAGTRPMPTIEQIISELPARAAA